jgi:hypothetical protein
MFRMVLFPVHNRIRFQLHTTKTELQQRTMGPMLLELKLLKYIVSTTDCKQDLVDDPCALFSLPAAHGRWSPEGGCAHLAAIRTTRTPQVAHGRGCRAKCRRPNIRTGRQHEVNSAAKCAHVHSDKMGARAQCQKRVCQRRCQLNPVSVGIAPCLGTHCWRAIFS